MIIPSFARVTVIYVSDYSLKLFLTALAKQLHTYALGRELGFADQAMLRAAVAGMKRENYTLRSLTQAVVASAAFREK